MLDLLSGRRRVGAVVTNTGNATLYNITVQDIFPQYVDFNSGSGNYDANTKTLTFTIGTLGSGQSQTFNLFANIVSTIPSSTTASFSCKLDPTRFFWEPENANFPDFGGLTGSLIPNFPTNSYTIQQ